MFHPRVARSALVYAFAIDETMAVIPQQASFA
jgi:hypothetical protein